MKGVHSSLHSCRISQKVINALESVRFPPSILQNLLLWVTKKHQTDITGSSIHTALGPYLLSVEHTTNNSLSPERRERAVIQTTGVSEDNKILLVGIAELQDDSLHLQAITLSLHSHFSSYHLHMKWQARRQAGRPAEMKQPWHSWLPLSKHASSSFKDAPWIKFLAVSS